MNLDIMRRADWAKYEQNADLAHIPLAAGSAGLIEDLPGDPFRGTGPDGHGRNWAGRVKMEIRQSLVDHLTDARGK